MTGIWKGRKSQPRIKSYKEALDGKFRKNTVTEKI